MKRFLTLFLALALIFSTIACSGEQNMKDNSQTTSATANGTQLPTHTAATTTEATSTEPSAPNAPPSFYAGYARADITPTFPVPLNDSISTGVGDKIYVTVVAVSDGEDKALIITADFKYTDSTVLSRTRLAARKHGVSEENVLISATHSHSSVDYLGNSYPLLRWKNIYYDAVDEAIEAALADLKPTTAEIGEGRTPNFAFVRRYYMEDGSFKSIHHANPSTDYKEHETEADDQLQVIRFDREGGKDIVLVNWQAHVAHAIIEFGGLISSDLVGIMRNGAEERFDVHFAYFAGASGNINLYSHAGRQIYKSYIHVGRALVDVLGTTLEDMTPVELGKIQVESTVYKARIDHSRDDLYDKAMLVSNYDGTFAEKTTYAKSIGFHSRYEAGSIITKHNLGESQDMPISALSFGDISFCAVPYEMFDTNGMEVKNASKFKSTFICTSANGRFGYIASDLGFQNGGYEVYSCRFVRGTGEEIANEYISLLEKLYNQK